MPFNIINRTTQTLFYNLVDQASGSQAPSMSILPNKSISYNGDNIPTSSKMFLRYPTGFAPTIIGPTSSSSNLYITDAKFDSKNYVSTITTSLTDPQENVKVDVLPVISYGQTSVQEKKQIEDANNAKAKLAQEQLDYAKNYKSPAGGELADLQKNYANSDEAKKQIEDVNNAKAKLAQEQIDYAKNYKAPSSGSNTGFIIIGIILLLISLAFYFYFFKTNKSKQSVSFGNRLKKMCKRF